MDDDVIEISFEELFGILLKNKFFIIFFAILGLLVSFLVTSFLIPKKYESSVKLYVYSPTAEQPSQELNALNHAQKVVLTYIQMLDARAFYDEIIDETGLNYTPEQMEKMIEVSALNNTEVFQAVVTTTSPEDSEAIARAVSNIAPGRIQNLHETAQLKIVDPAILAIEPSSPNLMLNLVIGLFLGLAVSFVIVFLKHILDVTIYNEEDISDRYGIPVLAAIPDFEEIASTNNTKKS